MLYSHIKSKPLYALSVHHENYINFIDENENLYLNDISLRLEEQLNQLNEMYSESSNLSQKNLRSRFLNYSMLKHFQH